MTSCFKITKFDAQSFHRFRDLKYIKIYHFIVSNRIALIKYADLIDQFSRKTNIRNTLRDKLVMIVAHHCLEGSCCSTTLKVSSSSEAMCVAGIRFMLE
jgi:hypothetical protein